MKIPASLVLLLSSIVVAAPSAASTPPHQYTCHQLYGPQAIPADKDGDTVTIKDLTIVPGYSNRHVHSQREYLVVESGAARVTIGSRPPVVVKAGRAIALPANIPHTVANAATISTDYLVFHVGSPARGYVNLDKAKAVCARSW